MTETRRTANFLRVRLIEPRIFDKRSFRTITLSDDGIKGIIACPKGQYQPRTKHCKVSTQLQAKLYPIKAKANPQEVLAVASSHGMKQEHDMYKRFHGKSPKVLMKAKHPKTPDVAIVLGRLDSVIYEKCSDGEKYIHKLGKNTLLVADKNGKLLIVNDSARITKRGIVG